MFEFMRNAFYALVGVLCISASAIVLTIALKTVINTVRRPLKGGNKDAA